MRRRFEFVGLTDEWELSACVFHLRFGGRCTGAEMHNSRATASTSTSELADILEADETLDPIDGALYEMAKARFEAEVSRVGADSKSCAAIDCDGVTRGTSRRSVRNRSTRGGADHTGAGAGVGAGAGAGTSVRHMTTAGQRDATERVARDRGVAAPQCRPQSGIRFPGTPEQWRAARDAMDVASADDAVVPGNDLYLAAPASRSETCEASFRGWRVVYIQVFKSNTQGICANLGALDDGGRDDDPNRTFTFTFVREPLDHFVSGYSEINHRVHSVQQGGTYVACRDCYDFTTVNGSETERATTFIRDLLQGCVASACCPTDHSVAPGVRHSADLHVAPQVAFLAGALDRGQIAGGRLDMIGDIDQMESEWARIGETISGWPPYDATETEHDHPRSDATSGSAARAAMQALVAPDEQEVDAASTMDEPSPERLAVCRVLLPDFACLNYDLPPDCAAAIGDAPLEAACPLWLRQALPDATVSARESVHTPSAAPSGSAAEASAATAPGDAIGAAAGVTLPTSQKAAAGPQPVVYAPVRSLCNHLGHDGYFTSVYGSESAAAPPCEELRMVWLPMLTNATLDSLEGIGVFESSPPERPFYMPISRKAHPPNALWITNATELTAAPPHGWIEVTHCGSEEEADGKYGIGAWFYAARGSGLSLNVGTTKVGDSHHHIDDNMTAALIDAGYDSMQFVQKKEFYSSELRHEVLMLGASWQAVAATSGADMALSGLLRCGVYPDLRRCEDGEAILRMHAQACGLMRVVDDERVIDRVALPPEIAGGSS
jgi:hypothetical protein